MEQHAYDLLKLALYFLGVLGVGFVSGLVWFGKGIIRRLENIETLLSSETRVLRELFHSVDKRVIEIEARHRLLDNHAALRREEHEPHHNVG